MSALRNERTSLQEDLELLQKSTNEMEHSLRQQRAELETAGNQRNELELRLEQERTRALDRQAQLETAAEQLRTETTARSSAEQKVEKLEGDLASLKGQVNQLYTDLETGDLARRQLEDELQTSTQALNRQKDRNSAATRRNEELEAKLARLQTQLEEKTTSLRTAQAQADSYNEKYELISIKYENMRAMLNEAQYKSRKQQETIETLKRQFKSPPKIAQVQNEVEQLQKSLDAKEVRLTQQAELIALLQQQAENATAESPASSSAKIQKLRVATS